MTTDADLHRCLQEISEIETMLADARKMTLITCNYNDHYSNRTYLMYRKLFFIVKKYAENDTIKKNIQDIEDENLMCRRRAYLYDGYQQKICYFIGINYRSIKKLIPILESQLHQLYIQIL